MPCCTLERTLDTMMKSFSRPCSEGRKGERDKTSGKWSSKKAIEDTERSSGLGQEE